VPFASLSSIGSLIARLADAVPIPLDERETDLLRLALNARAGFGHQIGDLVEVGVGTGVGTGALDVSIIPIKAASFTRVSS
jgi:hypothetical protein